MARWTPLPIVGGAYKDDTRPFSAQDCLNRLPVLAERPGTRAPGMLRDCPGAQLLGSLGDGPIRGLHNAEGLLHAVSGRTLYTITADGTATARGTIPGIGRVSMAHNQVTGGNEVAIANGLSGYVYNTKSETLSQITDTGFIGAKVFDFVDGYLPFVEPAGRFWGISDLAAATSYNTLDRSEAEAQPDKIVTLKVSHREIAVFGERSTEFYRNTGAATGTFQRVDGTELEIGCASTHGVAKLDNSLYFVGHDGCAYVLQGYQPIRISTHAVEQAWSRCNLAAAYCFTYEDQGHKVWYVTFTDGQTWGYDVATQEWHRRASQGLAFWRMAHCVRWNGRWITGDFSNGNLYQLDWATSNEAGAEMERSRTFAVIHDNQNRLAVNALELVYDTGALREPADITPLTIADIVVSGDVPDGVVGDTIAGSYTAIGGIPPYTYAVTAGTFPPGLALSAGGTYSGDYTTEGVYSWTITATDSEGNTGTLADTANVAIYTLPKAIYFALDNSGSMIIPPTRLATAKSALDQILARIQTHVSVSDVQVDVMGVSWGNDRTSINKPNASAADVQAVRDFFAAVTATGPTSDETDFYDGVVDATAFYAAAPETAERLMVFITDGLPTRTNGDSAATITADAVAVLNAITGLWVYAINIEEATITYTDQLDNTTYDGVPIVDEADVPGLVDAMSDILLEGIGRS